VFSVPHSLNYLGLSGKASTCIWEMTSSNLSRDIDYYDSVSSWFSFQENAGIVP
jgi:hypothetical protein